MKPARDVLILRNENSISKQNGNNFPCQRRPRSRDAYWAKFINVRNNFPPIQFPWKIIFAERKNETSDLDGEGPESQIYVLEINSVEWIVRGWQPGPLEFVQSSIRWHLIVRHFFDANRFFGAFQFSNMFRTRTDCCRICHWHLLESQNNYHILEIVKWVIVIQIAFNT